MGRGRVEITTELYQRLLGAFRAQGDDNYNAAARTVGCGHRLARRAYEAGFPENVSRGRPPLRPIRLVVEEERPPELLPPPIPPLPEHATADAVEPPDYFEEDDDSEVEEQPAPKGAARAPSVTPTAEIMPCGPVSMLEQPDGLRRHVVGAVDEELKTIAAARNAALGIISMATQVLAGMQPVIIRVRDSLRQQAESDEPANAEIAIKQLARIEEVVSSASETVKNLVQAERLALGSPTEILKVVEGNKPPEAPKSEDTHDSRQLLGVLAQLAANRSARPEHEPAEEEGAAYSGDEGGEVIEVEAEIAPAAQVNGLVTATDLPSVDISVPSTALETANQAETQASPTG